jgi:hypothetical protein
LSVKKIVWDDSLAGTKFGRWTILKFLRRDKYSVPYFLCRCDCGTVKEVLGYNLTRFDHRRNKATSTSCGCYCGEVAGNQVRKPFGEASFRQKYREIQRHAKERKIEMSLSEEKVKRIMTQNCHYCGIEPAMIAQANKNFNGHFIYNGIDRMDNTKGYVEGNCVPCCRTCNVSKNALPLDEWFTWIERVHKHIHAGSDLN